MLTRYIDLLISLISLGAGAFLALNYPLGSVTAIAIFLAVVLLAFFRPNLFLVLVPASLPAIGLAPWTGWMTFEELDILVLALCAGGYSRHALAGTPTVYRERSSFLLIILAALTAASITVSMTRGFIDAGGFSFDWFQGYDGPMNSVRIGKSFFLALLLVPLFSKGRTVPEDNASRRLALGIAIGLGTASLAALWERLAYTGLLNFSSDYRTTALFWEMHVGGAALDGWLLLTIPFSIWALKHSRNVVQILISLCLAALTAYVALTTFSRGVYLALLIALPLLAWQTRKPATASSHQPWGFARWIVAIVLLGLMASLVFGGSGYRGLLALLGLIVVSLPMPALLKKLTVRECLVGIAVGVLSGALLVSLADFVPKGPYVLYTLTFSLVVLLAYAPRLTSNKHAHLLATICIVALMASALDVANHWGGTEALLGMCGSLSLVILMLAWAACSNQSLWPDDMHWRGGLTTAAIVVCGVVAVFSGGKYMEDRFSTSSKDLDGRLSHWQQALSMLQTPWDIAFGKGLGRFPANYFFAIPDSAFPGTYQIDQDGTNNWLSLVGPRHSISFGDMLRISQRLPQGAQAPFEVAFKVKARTNVTVHAEVCAKHLLYEDGCAIGHARVAAKDGEWQTVRMPLTGSKVYGGKWYAPRFKTFSLGVLSRSGWADIDDIVLAGHGDSNLLINGNLSDGMKHWFMTSDRDHMPWHAKNLFVNVVFDQGLFGGAAFLLLTLGALWRLNLGKARGHELSPYLTAAIVGFLIVGLFDSLMDVPRVAFLYYFLVLCALSIRLQRNV